MNAARLSGSIPLFYVSSVLAQRAWVGTTKLTYASFLAGLSIRTFLDGRPVPWYRRHARWCRGWVSQDFRLGDRFVLLSPHFSGIEVFRVRCCYGGGRLGFVAAVALLVFGEMRVGENSQLELSINIPCCRWLLHGVLLPSTVLLPHLML